MEGITAVNGSPQFVKADFISICDGCIRVSGIDIAIIPPCAKAFDISGVMMLWSSTQCSAALL